MTFKETIVSLKQLSALEIEVNRSTNADGSIGDPWLRADWTISDIDSGRDLIGRIIAAIPWLNSVKLDWQVTSWTGGVTAYWHPHADLDCPEDCHVVPHFVEQKR